jgi:hypothetical protein
VPIVAIVANAATIIPRAMPILPTPPSVRNVAIVTSTRMLRHRRHPARGS